MLLLLDNEDPDAKLAIEKFDAIAFVENDEPIAMIQMVIIVYHADLNEDYFQDAIVENWWEGNKLMPSDW